MYLQYLIVTDLCLCLRGGRLSNVQESVDLVVIVRQRLFPEAEGGVLAVVQHLLTVHWEHVVHYVAQVAVPAHHIPTH